MNWDACFWNESTWKTEANRIALFECKGDSCILGFWETSNGANLTCLFVHWLTRQVRGKMATYEYHTHTHAHTLMYFSAELTDLKSNLPWSSAGMRNEQHISPGRPLLQVQLCQHWC